MPTYYYEARNDAGKKITGSLVANDEAQLEKHLSERRLFLVKARPQSQLTNFFEQFYGSPNDALMFSIQLATGLPSGISLIEILGDMIEEAPQGHFKKVLSDIKVNVEAGNSLSNALGLYPNYFSEVYRIIVATGEESGQLDVIFRDLVHLMEWERDLKAQIRKVMRFPITMIIMLTGLSVLVLHVVIPNFADLFKSGGTELPGPTLFLLATSEFTSAYWIQIVVGVVGLFVFYKWFASTDDGRMTLDKWILKLPFFGTIIHKIAMSRFAHFWNLLFSSGVDLSQTLEIVAKVVMNRQLEEAILVARRDIVNGRSMTDAFKESKLFPGLVLKMIGLGEATGALDASLKKISKYYDQEVPEAIDGAIAAFQPIMMMVMAAILVVVGLAIVLPMFSMMEAI